MEFVQLSSLFGGTSLKDSLFARGLLTILVICVCTRIVSGYRFRSIKYGTRRNVEPPTLPYWIPFLKHAISMGMDPPGFTARCLNKYGDGTPFFINAAGHKILVLLDSTHIKNVLNATKELSSTPFIHENIMGQFLGSPPDVVQFYKTDTSNVDETQIAHVRKHTTGTMLNALSESVFDRLKVSMKNACPKGTNEWTDIPDLFEFVQFHLTAAVTETLMGTQITKEYPGMIADQWLFMDKAAEFASGLPRFAMPAAYGARDRLLAHLTKWSRRSEALAREKKLNGHWDPIAGSTFVQERQTLYENTEGLSEEGRITQVLGLMVAANSITPAVSFWYLFETLRNADLRKRILAEMQQYYNSTTDTYDFMQLSVRPLLQSHHTEATRLYAANVAPRVVTAPVFPLDDKYTIEKGTTLFIYSKYAGTYTPGWQKVRPQALTKPLDQFWAERFLVDSADGKRERFVDTGLTGNLTSFGGGDHKCPGRFLGRNIGIVTLAIFLGEYECELIDPIAAQHAAPELRATAFGKPMPVTKIAVRIRKRQR